MSAQLKPSIGRRPQYGSDQIANLHKNRYLFSPFWRIDCRQKLYGDVPFDFIEPGTIHLVSDFRHPVRSVKRIQEEAKTEPEFEAHTRAAGYIFEGIFRNVSVDDSIPTGVVELVELIGLDPMASREDAELLEDLQATLMPALLPDGFAMLEWLLSREAVAAQKGAIYSATLRRMLEATNTAIDYYKIITTGLKDQLAQRAKGGLEAQGNRGRLYDSDKAAFAWIREDVPQLTSPFAQAGPQATPPPQVKEPSIPQVQCLECGAFANIIMATGQPPKRCVCGASFTADEIQPAADEPQPITMRVSDADLKEFDESTGGNKQSRIKAKMLDLQTRKPA